MPIAERSVTNLLDRYDAVLAAQFDDPHHLRRQLGQQDRIILAREGLRPDAGHEVLRVLCDRLSGTVPPARSLLSGTAADLAVLLRGGRGGGFGPAGHPSPTLPRPSMTADFAVLEKTGTFDGMPGRRI